MTTTTTHSGLVFASFVLAVAACSGAAPLAPTGEFATTGFADIRGRVLDLAGTPLDSFLTSGDVFDSNAFYTHERSISSASGTYTMRIRRYGAVGPDSVRALVAVQSTKGRDRALDGKAQYVSDTIWLRFSLPADSVASRYVDITVPFRRP